MKINRLFSIAAATMMMVACSSEDTALKNTPAAGPQMQFTATIAAPSSGATTRTIYNEDTQNKKITVAWKVDDEIALVHNGVKDVATVKTINSDGSATITGYVTGSPDNNDNVRLVYPAARVGTVTGGEDGTEYTADETVEGKLKTQDGTLAYIQDNLDFREEMGQLAVNGTEVTLTESADMSSSIAIWKLTLSDGTNNLSATQVKIKGGESVLASTTTLTAGTSVVTLAIPTDVAIDGALTIEATVGDDTYAYTKAEGATFNPGTYYQSTVSMAKMTAIDLSKLTADYKAQDGDVLTGTLNGETQPYKITIAAGATVTLDGVTITGKTDPRYKWAGITCEGAATIILKDGSTNTVKGFHQDYPGIHVPSEMTLTIKGETAGTGNLTASSNGYGAGIGGGYSNSINCGNIVIEGGVITANGGGQAAGIGSAGYTTCGSITISGGTVFATGGTDAAGIGSGGASNSTKPTSCGTITISGGTVTATGRENAAGIGSGYEGSCDDITISGGTVTATGGNGGAGIGSGFDGKCGDITITKGVTSVTATKGVDAQSIGIGSGRSGYCGTVTIGCTLDNDGKPVGGTTGAISTSPYTYDPNAATYTMAANATAGDVGKLICTDGHIHTYNADAACTKSRVAKIIYVGSSTGDATYNHGLALALDDEEGKMDWNNAKTACTNKNTSATVKSASWMLPSKTQWETMGATITTYTTLPNGFTSVGGSNLEEDYYWSSTENDTSNAWMFLFSYGSWDWYPKSTNSILVRACLAF